MSIDFDGLRAANPIADVVGRYIDLRRAGSEWQARCPFHNDRSPSFYVVPKKAKAFCMACGWQGDVVDFVAEIDGVDTKEAARRLGHDELPTERRPLPPLPPDHSDDWVPIVPVPKSVAQPFVDQPGGRWVVFNPKRERDSTLKPAASWAYRDAAGALLGWVVRCVFDDGRKWTPAVTWCRHRETGEERWCLRPFPKPRPLYGLDALAARPQAPVLLVEGEKCADVRALPGFVLVSWPGGTNGAAHVDFSPLYGRAVTGWPDADPGGLEVIDEILAGLAPHGGALRVIDVAGQPKGWDIADAVAEGMGTAALVAWCKARVRTWEPAAAREEEAGARIEGGDGCNAVREVSEGAPAGSDSTPSDAISATDAATDAPAAADPEPAGADRCEPAPLAAPAFFEDEILPPRRVEAALDTAADPEADGLPEMYSEDNVALRFAQVYADDLRYVASWGRWMRWDGRRWLHDDSLMAFDMARKVCRSVAVYARQDFTITPKQQQSVASKYGQAQTVAAIERMARADRRHAATVDQWDADLWALNTPGGVVDLRTGALRAPRRDDHMTKITRVAPGGGCPEWLRFLERATQGDAELQGFLKRVAGYSLTGSTRDQALFFIYGTGGNGKGTFLNTLTWILNDYASVAGIDTFTETKADRHTTELARLRGARMVVAQEVEEGKRWAEAKIKALTGGDPITARFMRMDDFTFIPQFKLVIAGNHKPGLRSVDEAIKRRMHLIPFTASIPAHERDPKLAEKLLAEAPGILAWAVEGCVEWLNTGLRAPLSVQAATDDYLEQQDALGAWIEECIEVDPHKQGGMRSSILYASFKRWAEMAGEYVLPQKRWVAAMESRGYTSARRANGVFYTGLKLAEHEYDRLDLM